MKQRILKSLAVTALIPILFLAPSVYAQGKFSGYMFGDYYYILGHSNSDLKDQNGFWFKRIYLTYDYKISEAWSTRLRFELASPGDFKTKDTVKPFVKDAYLAWTKGKQEIILGISPTPTWEYVEGFWGYRSVEKTPLDLYKMGDSRDFGIAFKGSFDARQKVSYHIQVANGEGTKSEVNKEKKLMGSLLFKIGEDFSLEVYGDYAREAEQKSYWTYQGFLGWKEKKARLGMLYSHQVQQKGPGQEELAFDVISLIGAADLSEKIALLFRYDRMSDPIPAAPTISYVPLDGRAAFHMIIAGLDLHLEKGVNFIPNLMLVLYDKDKSKGIEPDSDLHLKLTFFYKF